MKQVLITMPLEKPEDKILFTSNFKEFNFHFYQAEVPEEILRTAEVIIGQPTLKELEKAENLKWLQLSCAGADRYLKKPDLFKQVLLTNVTGAFGRSISEYLLTMVLTLYKKMHLYRDLQRMETWQDMGEEKSIHGKTVLIVGAGDIGNSFAKLLTLFKTRCIGICRTKREARFPFDEIYTLEDIDELLPEADIVALCLPSTDKTRHLFDRRRLLLMKQDAILLNVGRGDAIVTKDLCKVLEEGYLLGAALDVVEPEPLLKGHPLWQMDNVILTPHISGGSFTHLHETYEKILEICVGNLKRFANGEELENVIDLDTGYARK